VGKHFATYVSLRDNHEEIKLSSTEYLDTRPGARYKSGNDFSEMRGGISLSWNWGTIGLVKDHVEWGNYYHYPNIISSKAPSLTHIKLQAKPVNWFEFNYIHTWLVSGVVDSLRSYSFTNSYGTGYRTVYRQKYMAANMFTFKPMQGLFFSFGNSIIYSDTGVDPVYLIPVFFYKSIDHTKNQGLQNDGGQNSQLFFDISSRQVKHLHLFATVFFDDLSISRLKKNGHFDYYSLKMGFGLSNLIPNIEMRFEYIQTYPLVYKHIVPTTSYESNLYNLGHYLQDNSRGFSTELIYSPFKGFRASIYHQQVKRGPDHEELGTPRLDVVHMFLDELVWESNTYGLNVQYQPFNRAFLFFGIEKINSSGVTEVYTSEYYRGNPLTVSLGVNYAW